LSFKPRSKTLTFLFAFALLSAGLFSCSKGKPAPQLVLSSESPKVAVAAESVAAEPVLRHGLTLKDKKYFNGTQAAMMKWLAKGDLESAVNIVSGHNSVQSLGCSWKYAASHFNPQVKGAKAEALAYLKDLVSKVPATYHKITEGYAPPLLDLEYTGIYPNGKAHISVEPVRVFLLLGVFCFESDK
jgi:hypothetical protein